MTITVLDRRDVTADSLPATLGELHDTADTVPDELLPCRVNDSDLWFAESPAELERAKTLCESCPIRIECLAGALSREEPWGVWGGEIFERGVVVPRKRPRGRPSKADLARDRAWAEAHQKAQERARQMAATAAARPCA